MKTKKETIDKVWVVTDGTYVSVYADEKAARKEYWRICVNYELHTRPTANDLWSYKIDFRWVESAGDPYDCTYFIAKHGCDTKRFSVRVFDTEVLK